MPRVTPSSCLDAACKPRRVSLKLTTTTGVSDGDKVDPVCASPVVD